MGERAAQVKLESIARAAGVSQSVVSKVVNNRPGVAAATRQRIERLLDQAGYQRRWRGHRSRAVEVVFRTLGSAINPLLLRGLAQSLHGSRYTLTVTATGCGTGLLWLDEVLDRHPAGVILAVSPLSDDIVDRFHRAATPVVVLDTFGDALPRMNVVGSTNWRGGYLATRHVLDLGHRRIGLIGGPPDLACCRARVDGYYAALREAAVPADPALIRSSAFEASPARDLAHDLLDQPRPPTAIVTGNDLQALGVIDACYDRRLRVPDDLSIVGYDDQDVAAFTVPALTTVHQPLAEMGQEAGEILKRLIDEPGSAPIRLDLAAELVFRRTTGAVSR